MNSSYSNISNTNINITSSSDNKIEKNYLQKKTKRSNFINKHNIPKYIRNKTQDRNNYNMKPKFPNNNIRNGSKTVIHYFKNKRRKKQNQSKMNDYFSKPNFNDINIDNSLFQNDMSNSFNQSTSLSLFEEYNISNNNMNINKKNVEEISKKIINVNHKKKDINIGLTSLKQNSNKTDKYISLNPFSKFSKIINHFKEPDKIMKDNDINCVNNNIFNKSEISLALKIQKEFKEEINNLTSETDKLIKGTLFFINKGFNEHIRYIFYKHLINHGFPSFNNFNIFYENLILECKNEKLNTPDKMYIEFYTEYIFHLLINNKISMGNKKFISGFFFNNENIEIIKKNLNFIINIKENNTNINSYIQQYLECNFDIIINGIDIKLNKKFPKSKAVLCKIISNVVSECDKNGYLKYKKIINNDNILFNGLKIKGMNNTKMNLRKMISLKIFGQELSDKKFYNLILDLFLQLFSTYSN